MTLDFSRTPRCSAPPAHAPACCTQVTITVPTSVNQKTAQRHDYLSRPWRRSSARRSASERSNARIKDPAMVDVARGWCRVMGLVPMGLFLACALAVRNLAVADAFDARRQMTSAGKEQGCPGARDAGDARRSPTWSGPRRMRRHSRRRFRGDVVSVAPARPSGRASGSSAPSPSLGTPARRVTAP